MYQLTQTTTGRTFIATYSELVERYGRDAFRDMLLGKLHNIEAHPIEGH